MEKWLNRKIKLIHIIPSLETGGMENGIVNVVNRLDTKIFSPMICCLRKEGNMSRRLNSNVQVKCLHGKEGFDYSSPLKMARLFVNEKADIVHTHGWGGGLLAGTIGAKLAGVPIVINSEHGFWRVDKKRRIYAQKILSYFTDQITTVSEDLRNKINKCFGIPLNRIVSISNGVDAEKFRPSVLSREIYKKKLNMRADEYVIGTVGRLVPVKDHPTLLKAAASLINKKISIKLILVGDGPVKSELIQLIDALKIGSCVSFLGERADIPELLNAMDLFVLPSVTEGMSNTLLEAMACGIPVIATDVGGNPEIIRDGINGFLIPPRNSDVLSETIEKMYSDKRMARQMGIMSRKIVEKKFSLTNMVKNYQDMYIRCLIKRRIVS